MLGEGVLGVEGEELAVVLVVVDIGWRKLRDNMIVLFFVFYFFCFVVSSKSRKLSVCCVFGEIMRETSSRLWCFQS